MSKQTPAELLARVNVKREADGKKPLKTWKGSREKLEQMADAVQNGPTLAAKGAYENDRQARDRTGVGTSAPKRKAPGRKPSPAAKSKGGGDTFTLSELAGDLKLAPKLARAKARRNEKALNKFIAKGATGWTFDKKHRTSVRAIIEGDKK